MNGFITSRWRVAPLVGVALSVSLLAAFVYLYASARFFAPIAPDEEQFIWQGSLINNGDVPYRDFFEPKPPVIFFANALGLALFGFKDLLFRIVPTVVAVAALLFFYLAMIRRKVVPWLIALLTAQAALWLLGSDFHDNGLNDTETYGFCFTLLGFSIGSLSDSLKVRSGKDRIAGAEWDFLWASSPLQRVIHFVSDSGLADGCASRWALEVAATCFLGGGNHSCRLIVPGLSHLPFSAYSLLAFD